MPLCVAMDAEYPSGLDVLQVVEEAGVRGPPPESVAGVGAGRRRWVPSPGALLAEGISEAAADASPLEAVAAGLERASSAMGPMNRELGPRLKAAVAASTELQERDALKSVGLAAAMTTALVARGVPGPTAQLAGELGVLAFKQGYARWSEGDRDDGSGLAHHPLAALQDLRTAATSLG